MRRHALLLLLFLTPMVIGGRPLAAQQKPVEACEPNFRIDAPEVAAEREAKKARMRENGVPERYLHLLDHYRCAWCLKTAPDAVHVTIVYKEEFAPRLSDGRIDKVYTIRLLPQIERQLRDDLSTGRIESFHVFISEKRCRCCPDDDQQAEDYDDWNGDLGANTDQVDSFDDPSDLPPLPDDLKNAPSGWVPPPPIEKFEKPHPRGTLVTCAACRKLADQWTDVAATLDYLWDRKLSLQRQMNATANAIGNRLNDINDLEYQQRFTTSRTLDRGKQIETLKQVNADQQSGIDREARQLAGVEQQIAETEARLDALMEKVVECEKACSKTLTTYPAQTTATTAATTTATTAPIPGETPAGNAARPPVTFKPAIVPAGQPDPCKRCEELERLILGDQSEIEYLEREVAEYTATDNLIRSERQALYEQRNLMSQRLEASKAGEDPKNVQAFAARIKEIDSHLEKLVEANDSNLRDAEYWEMQLQEAKYRLQERRWQHQNCLKACGGSTGTGNAGDPVDPERVCEACQDLANRVAAAKTNLNVLNARLQNIRANQELLRAELTKASGDAAKARDIQGQLNQLTQAFNNTIKEQTAALAEVNRLERELATCKRFFCETATANRSTDTNTVFGPIDQDCRVPGTPCSYAYTPRVGMDWPKVNLNDPVAWGNVLTVTIEIRVQRIGTDVFDPANYPHLAQPLAPINATVPKPDQQPPPEVVIPPTETPKVGAWFNPLGLLARRLVDHVDRWRGSMGPRPLITPRDLALVDSVSSTQSLGLPKGLHFLMVHQGGSSGKTVAMQVLNLSGRPVRLQSMPFVMEPLQRQAQEQVQKAFTKLSKLAPVRLDLNAYCTEFLKLPPTPNTIMRLAPPEIQKQFEPMSKVLRSAYRIKNAGLLHPDSDPAAYTDSIKQWALWTVEQKLSESRYVDAFLAHTKKNMEGGGQKWSKQAEDVIRQVSPNRWRDIVQILRGAGVAVPQ